MRTQSACTQPPSAPLLVRALALPLVHPALPAGFEVGLLGLELRVEPPLAGHALRVHLGAVGVAGLGGGEEVVCVFVCG
jgi:hypothetical protein